MRARIKLSADRKVSAEVSARKKLTERNYGG
jgi:hypothetical protein